MLIHLLLVALLVLLNGFFVAAEFALVKVRQTYLEQLENQGNKKAKITRKVVSNLNVYLNTCQFGITLASLGLGWVGEPAIAHYIVEPIFIMLGLPPGFVHTVSFIIAFSVMTFLHIVLGEIVPKTIAIQKSDNVSLWSSAPLMWFYKITLPFVWILNGSSNLVLKMMGIQPTNEHEAAHTEEELRIMMGHSHKSGHINETEMELIESAFDFADKKVRQVMVPRINMSTLNADDNYEEVMNTIRKELYTRYPVIKEDKDNVIGYVHLKDLIVCNREEFSLFNHIRKLETLQESTETSEALELMKKKRVQIALVMDEYGGTAGMITMEDLLEEIVDEIRDEFDMEELAPVVEISNGYSVDAKVLIEEINDLTGLSISDEEIDTIGGFMYKELNGEVKLGDQIDFENISFSVESMNENHINRIVVHTKAKEEI